MNELTNEIKDLDSINNWGDKLEKIKNIKTKINTEETNINNMINNLDDYKDVKISKKFDIDKIINEFDNLDDINLKIKNYQLLSKFIDSLSNDLFD
jgi:hypothetical protein